MTLFAALYSLGVLVAVSPDAGTACVPDRNTRQALRIARKASVPSGATWTCVVGRADSIQVILRVLQAHDEQEVHESIVLRRIHAAAPFQTIPVDVGWGFAILAKRGEGISAIDVDGDGLRDILIESQRGRGANRGSSVFLYDLRSSTLVRDRQLSGLMNVKPSAPGCVRHSMSDPPGPIDFIEGEYCRRDSEWVETSRVESTRNEATGRRVRRHYVREGSAMVFTRADSLRR